MSEPNIARAIASYFEKNFLASIAVGILVVIAIGWVTYLPLINHYEEESYNPNTYVGHDEYRKEITKAFQLCKSSELPAEEKYKHCEYAENGIAREAAISDLGAQQTMAMATRGILVGTWFQIIVGSVALVFLAITVWQSRVAAVAASGALAAADRTAQAAESADRAHVVIVVEGKFCGPKGSKKTIFKAIPSVVNYGRTPAKDITINAEIDWIGRGFRYGADSNDIDSAKREYRAKHPERFKFKTNQILGPIDPDDTHNKIDMDSFQKMGMDDYFQSFRSQRVGYIEEQMQADESIFYVMPFCSIFCYWEYTDIFQVRRKYSSEIRINFTAKNPSKWLESDQRTYSLLSRQITTSEHDLEDLTGANK